MNLKDHKLAVVCCSLLACLIGASCVGVWAVGNFWDGSVSWNYIESEPDPVYSISVSNPDGDGAVNFGDVEGPQTLTTTYTVLNDGNQVLTVTAIANPTGATASWSKTGAVLNPGEATDFVLTLQITGAGSCNVGFAIS